MSKINYRYTKDEVRVIGLCNLHCKCGGPSGYQIIGGSGLFCLDDPSHELLSWNDYQSLFVPDPNVSYEESFNPKRKCVMCGKPRTVERNPGQHNDGDDFCSDKCYYKFDEEHAHIAKSFVDSLGIVQIRILGSIYEGRSEEQGRIIFRMIEEQLDLIAQKIC